MSRTRGAKTSSRHVILLQGERRIRPRARARAKHTRTRKTRDSNGVEGIKGRISSKAIANTNLPPPSSQFRVTLACISLEAVNVVRIYSQDNFQEIVSVMTGEKENHLRVCEKYRMLEDSGIFFCLLTPRSLPKILVCSSILIPSLSSRASSRYVFPSRNDVPDPSDCKKGLVSDEEEGG